jgi:hypothetical protein
MVDAETELAKRPSIHGDAERNHSQLLNAAGTHWLLGPRCPGKQMVSKERRLADRVPSLPEDYVVALMALGWLVHGI